MRWLGTCLALRLALSVLGLAAILSAGLAAPSAPSGGELRAVAHALAGGSFADICGSGGHPADGAERCARCCLAAVAPPPGVPRAATRVLPGPRAQLSPRRANDRPPARRDRTRRVRAPPRA